MKKIRFVILFLLLASMLTLTSCKVNWFDKQYDVPWYIVAVPTLIICCVAFFIAGMSIAKKLYVCPKCGGEFHPNFWLAMCSMHIGSDRYFRCPHCGHKGFCSVSRKSGEE